MKKALLRVGDSIASAIAKKLSEAIEPTIEQTMKAATHRARHHGRAEFERNLLGTIRRELEAVGRIDWLQREKDFVDRFGKELAQCNLLLSTRGAELVAARAQRDALVKAFRQRLPGQLTVNRDGSFILEDTEDIIDGVRELLEEAHAERDAEPGR